MGISKFSFACTMAFLLSMSAWANNVKIVGDVKVIPSQIKGNIAPFEFTVEWENSWRDEFNYDAVYVFLKYKLDGADEAWNHVYLTDEVILTNADGLQSGYASQLINSSGTANRNEGIMVWKEKNGFGTSKVTLALKWDFTSGERRLEYNHFNDGKVFLSAMAIEMVYIPQGAFRAGDSKSTGNRFAHKFLPIPAASDLMSESFPVETKENKINTTYPPAYAANRMNDNDRTTRTNCWVGDGSDKQFLRYDMKTAQTVRYIAVESVPGWVPATWKVYGMNDNTGGVNTKTELYAGTATEDWVTAAPQAYPATKAIKLTKTGAYRYYEVEFTAMGGAQGPAIKTLAMTSDDLGAVYNNSVLITQPQTKMTALPGYRTDYLYTDATDTQSGTTTAVYPNGYAAFFTMKYEISQEQYVAFLNKLMLSQQAARTVGEKLVSLKPGDYLFGADPSKPTARNGIILASRNGLTDPLVFANNLNKADGEFAQDGDGQTLACNFLSPSDMLAYADWVGLRPMSELEYEKMSRQPFPATPKTGEYAWNSTIYTKATALIAGTEGKKSETVAVGNANAENALGGPVRCGAFAKAASSQEASGASFWGVMDLSGNLAELYYNLHLDGQKFSGIPRGSHGNGKILASTGESDVSSGIWPVIGNAFALRGGSFKSASTALETSDRTNNNQVYETGKINDRREEVTFRLGCSMPAAAVNSVLTLQNGLTTEGGKTPADTICSGEDYLISGDIPATISGAYTIAWFYCGDNGGVWEVMEGENGKDLRLTNLRNIHVGDNVLKTYNYMRHIYSNGVESKSDAVTIRVVNTEILILPRELSVNVANASATVAIQSFLPISLTWQFKDNPAQPPMKVNTPGKNFAHTPLYTDFTYGGSVNTGKQALVFYHTFYDKFCPQRDTVWVNVIKAPDLTDNSANVVCGQAFKTTQNGVEAVYNTTGIGTQCWMVENLNNPVGESKCYGDDVNNCAKYGRLYNWVQATGNVTAEGPQGVCPAGWHLPSNAEWTAMNTASGSGGENLKHPTWGGSVNQSGFSALPGGGRFYTYTNANSYTTTAGILNRPTNFYDVEARAWWWTSTNNPNLCYYAPEYYAWYNDYNRVTYIPYYVMLDSRNVLQFNVQTGGFNRRDYIGNSIFCTENVGGNSNGSYSFLAGNNDNSTALTRMRNEFYMSVRCVRDRDLTPSETK
ncbi:MAG: FISUMP domain-containing protein [Odoribacter sp.]